MEEYKNCKGYRLYIKNGYVVNAYGQKSDGNEGILYPYKWSKKYRTCINVSGQVAYNTLRQKLGKSYTLF